MPDYSKTKIYKIWSHLGDKIYIGSTTKNYLSERMTKHREDYKRWKAGKSNKIMSYGLFDEYGIENCKIELIEAKSCTDKDEQLQLEGKYMREMKCINKCIAGRTLEQYYQDNKGEILEHTKQYRKDNQEALKLYETKYYETHKEKIRETKSEKLIVSVGWSIPKVIQHDTSGP